MNHARLVSALKKAGATVTNDKDFHGRTISHLHAATEDFAGNVYDRLRHERAATVALGNENRKAKKKGAA